MKGEGAEFGGQRSEVRGRRSEAGEKEASRYRPRGTCSPFTPLTDGTAKGLAPADPARRTGNLSHSGDAFELESSGSPTGRLTTKNTVFSSRILLWKQVRKQVGKLSLFCAIAGWIREPNCAVQRRWTQRGA